MKSILILACILFSMAARSQSDTLPMKEGKAFFEFIDTAGGLTASQIYNGAINYFTRDTKLEFFSIRRENKEESSALVVMHFYVIMPEAGIEDRLYSFDCIIDFQAKEGRSRVRFIDFTKDDFSIEATISVMRENKKKSKIVNMLCTHIATRIAEINQALVKKILEKDDF